MLVFLDEGDPLAQPPYLGVSMRPRYSPSRCRETPRLKTEPSLNNPENSRKKAISNLFTDPPFSLLEVVERAYENKNRGRFIDRKGKGARG